MIHELLDTKQQSTLKKWFYCLSCQHTKNLKLLQTQHLESSWAKQPEVGGTKCSFSKFSLKSCTKNLQVQPQPLIPQQKHPPAPTENIFHGLLLCEGFHEPSKLLQRGAGAL